MKILKWFRKKPSPAPVAKNNRSENLKRAVERARMGANNSVEAYCYPIKPPELLGGIVPDGVTAPVLAMDNAVWQMAAQMYPTGGFVGFPYLAQLATRPEYRAFSSAISTELTRKWIAFTSTQTDDDDHSEKIKLIESEFKRLKIRSLIQRVAENDVLFGRGHIAIKIKGHDDATPMVLSPKTITQGSLDAFVSVEPIWSTPSAYNAIDPTAKDFYRPTSWYLLGKQIHASRLLTVVTRPLPDMLKPAFNFAGMSLSQLAEPYVDNWLRTRQSVSDLINNFSLTILKTSLDQVLSGGDGSDIDSRAQLFVLNKSNKGLMIVDNEREGIEQINTPLGGLHELQAQSQEQMCAVSKIPAVVLTGISPNGMNASSDGELQAFNDWIAAQQEAFYRDTLEIILKIVQLHLFGEIISEIGFKFLPLREMTAEQQANIRNINAQIAANYISAGVLDPAEERERLATDPDSGYQGINVDAMPETEEEDEEDIAMDAPKWITVGGGTNTQTGEGTGRHFQIDDETGKILKGGSPEMRGKTFKEAFSDEGKNLSERQKLSRHIAEHAQKKYGGDKGDFTRLAAYGKRGQSADYHAKTMLKEGNVPSEYQEQQDKRTRQKKQPVLTQEQQAATDEIAGNPFNAAIKGDNVVIAKKDTKGLSSQDVADLRFYGFKYDDKGNLSADLGGAEKIAYILNMREEKKKAYEQSQQVIESRKVASEADRTSSNKYHDESRTKEWEDKKSKMPSAAELNKNAVSLLSTNSNAFNALRHVVMNTEHYKSERDKATPSDKRSMIPFNNAVANMHKALKDSGINSDMSDVDAFIELSNLAKTPPSSAFDNPAIKSLMTTHGGGYWGFRAVADKKLGELLTTKVSGGSDKQNKWANDIVSEALFEHLIKKPNDLDGAIALKKKLESKNAGKIIEFRNHLSQIL